MDNDKNKNSQNASDRAYEAEREGTKRDVDGRFSSMTGGVNVPGINTPGVSLPAFNPPVPNRAWTAMRMGKDIDELTEDEKRDLYMGRDTQI